jgi:N-acetylglucosamine-6-phosphate deacetylase
MIHVRATNVATGQRITVRVADGRIATVSTEQSAARPDVEAQYVAPAFFDIQINGGGGIDFSSGNLTVEQVATVVALCRRHGIGCFLPTLVTSRYEALHSGMRTLRQAVEQDQGLARALPGIHLEGPYLSPEDGPRGAHPLAHIRPPSRDEFQRLQDAAGGRIRLVTLAPEHEGAIAFIGWLAQQGIIVAIGHTAAKPSRIREAIAAGARLSTHLGNGCHLTLPRHDNYLWEQLAADELWASLIADGHHLPPPVLRSLLRGKTPARCILTCDASSLAGMPPGRYAIWGAEIDVLPEGKIVVPKFGVLAGSGSFTDACVARAVRLGGVTLAESVAMVTDQPRALFNLPPVHIAPGQPADLVLFDLDERGEMDIRAMIVDGQFERRAAS